MAPFDLTQWPNLLQHGLHLLIGLGFGAILEQAGFGNSKRLAMQFYFRDLTVLKVMFGAIITAMLLIFLSAGLGFLDFSQVYVNTTFLWPGIVGGLIMGVGFIIGGFCPGTSLVSAATLKIDGIFFVLGALVGVSLFGETVDSYAEFWNSSDYGRLTLFDLTGTGPGIVVLGAVLMALGMFKGGEWLETRISKQARPKLPWWGVGAYVGLALVVLAVGYPNVDDRWEHVRAVHDSKLQSRAAFISPHELLTLHYNDAIDLHLWDLRSEEDFNRFHFVDAKSMDFASLENERETRQRTSLLANSVIVLTDWEETLSVQAYKRLAAYRISNIYILDGGMKAWLETFKHLHNFSSNPKEGRLPCPWDVPEFFGSRHPAAEPKEEELKTQTFTPKVKLELGSAKKGGCG